MSRTPAILPSQGDPNVQADRRAFSFDLRSEIEALKAEPLTTTGRTTRSLASLPSLRVLLVRMKADSTWQEHTAPGKIIVQTVAGHIRMGAFGQILDMPAGNLVVLDARIPHDVVAIQDSVFLLIVDRDVEGS